MTESDKPNKVPPRANENPAPEPDGRLRMTFSKRGVDLTTYLRFPMKGLVPHTEHLDYPDLGNIHGSVTILGGSHKLDPKTGQIAEITLDLLPGALSDGGAQSSATVAVAATFDPAEQTTRMPNWKRKFLEQVNMPGTLPYLVTQAIEARGRITRADLIKLVQAAGYTAGSSGQGSGAVWATIQILRDELHVVYQEGRAGNAAYVWTKDKSQVPAQTQDVTSNSIPLEHTANLPRRRPRGGYTGKPIAGFVLDGTKYATDTYKDLLLKISEILVKSYPAMLDQLLRIRSTKHPYVSKNPSLLRSPIQITGTSPPVYVETNLNADLIVRICERMLEAVGRSRTDLRVALR